MSLPDIMVAPNGARLTKSDHPALPITIPEICATAASCFAAGARGLHLHIRDQSGRHLLDAGKYREALAELDRVLPEMALQITSEAAGIYSPEVQRKVVLDCKAPFASVSVKEMAREVDDNVTRKFYQACESAGIKIQHIIYEPQDLDLLSRLIPPHDFTSENLQLLFVMGRYSTDGAAGPEALKPFLEQTQLHDITPDWAACAFGVQETRCLIAAHQAGGKVRIGFENSTLNMDGSTAGANAERIAEFTGCLKPELRDAS